MNKKTYIHREIEKILQKTKEQFPALVLVGPRQSGKSTLLKQLFKKTHQFLSFDDPLVREKAITDPKNFLENLRGKSFVLDEIQYVPEILSYLKILIDKRRNQLGQFILTGSQQFNLMKNLTESLAGRIAVLTLLPFSKYEKNFLHLKNTQNYFVDACLRSSFPEISVREELNFETWYGSYVQTYLERDVRSIYDIGSLREFQRFLQLLAAQCAQILNLNSLSRNLGVSVNTLKKWISVLEASQIIYLLSPYYRNLGKRVSKTPKIYFLDNGLVCYLSGLRDKKHLLNGPMAGPLWENYVVSETIKTYYNFGKRLNIFYLRTHNNLEIDLIVENNQQLFPIEIKLSKTPNINMARPIERFKKTFSQLDIGFGKIVCLSEQEIDLTSETTIQTLDNYLQWLKESIK